MPEKKPIGGNFGAQRSNEITQKKYFYDFVANFAKAEACYIKPIPGEIWSYQILIW